MRGRLSARRAAAAALVALAAAGCGQTVRSGSPTTPSSSATTSTGTASPGGPGGGQVPGTPGARIPEPLPMLSASQTAGLSRMQWDKPSVDGTTVVVHVAFGGCSGPPVGATVSQAPGTVTLTVWDRRARPGTVCAQYELAATVTVILPSPLGGRTLTGGTQAP